MTTTTVPDRTAQAGGMAEDHDRCGNAVFREV
jgi:hypothetical protein